jgi:hypothetical protein
MGRLAHLTRLALGRSAFEELEANQDVDQPLINDDVGYRQQYDSKGRPINPRTVDIEVEVCHAQNEILELVGIVEKKDKIVQDDEAKYQEMRQMRHQRMKIEDEYGRNISAVFEFVCPLLRIWVVDFIARLQTGVYPSGLRLCSILAKEWHILTRNGLSRLLPGLESTVIVDNFLDREWTILSPAMKICIGGLQSYILAGSIFKPTTERRVLNALPSIFMGLAMIPIDRLLLPFMIYADAQRLGLAPLDLTFLPPELFSNAAFRRTLWHPLKSIGRLSALTSPAVLMLLYRSCFKGFPVQTVNAQDLWSISMRSRVFQMFTSYRNPTIDDGYKHIDGPTCLRDPFGWILYQSYQLRTSLLKCLGWTMTNSRNDYFEQDDSSLDRYESGRLAQDVSARPTNVDSVDRYRSTLLAQLPAQFLANRVDYWMANILLLPLSSTILRGVARIFIGLPLPKTRIALEAARHTFAPFGGGPFGQLVASRGSRSAWTDVCVYSGRLCFGATLYMATDILAFGMLYGAVNFIGIRRFGWGSKSSGEEGMQDTTGTSDPL